MRTLCVGFSALILGVGGCKVRDGFSETAHAQSSRLVVCKVDGSILDANVREIHFTFAGDAITEVRLTTDPPVDGGFRGLWVSRLVDEVYVVTGSYVLKDEGEIKHAVFQLAFDDGGNGSALGTFFMNPDPHVANTLNNPEIYSCGK